jgi:hypothetical protein
MSFRRRTVRFLAILVVLAGVGVAAFLWLRGKRSPESVRLLPEADAVVFFDVKTLRTLGAFSAGSISRDPEYERFVAATGFQFERDLDEAAFAVHAGKPPAGDAALGPDTRFSEIFLGHFDVPRARAYFRQLASGAEMYRDIEVYTIPHEGRQVKVAILGVDRVAVSNTDSREPLRRMIDRYRSGAMHATGPSLVGRFRDRIPLGSLVWAVARMGDGAATPGLPAPALLANLSGTTIVASVRPMFGGAQFRLEDIAGDSAQAQRIVEQLNAGLLFFRQLEIAPSTSGSDADVKQVFESLAVEQHDSSAVLTATVPPGFLKKITSTPPELPAEPAPAPSPAPAPKRRR